MRVDEESLPIRLLTHNIRYATESPFPGEQPWHIRSRPLVNELRFNTAHCAESFICLQEVLHNQLVDILTALNGENQTWASVGVGRDNGKEAGEYSPIIYRPGLWRLEESKTVWLSETPDRPSKGWDAACVRILTIAVFLHHRTRKRVVAMNTHLDDQGSESRLQAAKIILDQIRSFTDGRRYPDTQPVFLAGDFNSEPSQEAYKEMTNSISPMADLRLTVREDDQYGEKQTFTGFTNHTRPKIIDFIFLNSKTSHSFAPDTSQSKSVNGPWQINAYAILPNRFEDGVYNSDHRAVVGDVLLA